MIFFEVHKTIAEKGLKKIFIARRMGLDPTVFSKKLNGYTPMSEGEKMRIAQILGQPVKKLFPPRDGFTDEVR